MKTWAGWSVGWKSQFTKAFKIHPENNLNVCDYTVSLTPLGPHKTNKLQYSRDITKKHFFPL